MAGLVLVGGGMALAGWSNRRAGHLYVLSMLTLLLLCLGLWSGDLAASPARPVRSLATAPGVVVGPAPGWVDPSPVPPARPIVPSESRGGVAVLLIDRQVRVDGPRGLAPANPQRVERYLHLVRQVTHTAGVEELSQVSLDFDPTYETLVLHRVTIHRNGRRLERLDAARIELLRREPRLEAQMYDGRQTALLVLDDLRVGDIVEEAFTRTGSQPALGGTFTDGLGLTYPFPVDRLRYRLDWPVDRQVRIAVHGSPEVLHRERVGGHDRYQWDHSNVAAISKAPDTPEWHDPTTWVQASEFPSWAAVAAWAVPLYEAAGDDGEALEAVATAIEATATSVDARVAAAVRFVQDDVRYMSIALGTGSLHPTAPATTLARRYGDCKDKSLLLVKLLRRLGVAARPTLVSSERHRGIETLLPSTSVFDHVIVQVRLADAVLWIDPTVQQQRGGVRSRWLSRFGRGLVIDRDTTDLATIQPPAASAPWTSVAYAYTLGVPGARSTLTIRTEKRGGAADFTRAELASRPRTDLERDYLNFYVRTFPGLETAAPLAVEDNEAENVVTTIETYAIPKFWTIDEAKKSASGSAVAFEILDSMRRPEAAVRTAPLAVGYPSRMDVKLSMDLPHAFAIDPASETVESAGFKLDYAVTATPRHVDVTFAYAAKVDAVAMADLTDHIEKLARGRSLIEFGLETPAGIPAGGSLPPASTEEPAPGPLNSSLVVLVGILVLAASATGVGVYRRIGRPVSDPPPDALPIGGWLALPAIGLIFAPLRSAWNLRQFGWVFDADRWHSVATTHATLSAWVLVEIVLNSAALAVWAIAAALFFRRMKSAPAMVMLWYGIGIGLMVLDEVLLRVLDVDATAAEVTPIRTIFTQTLFTSLWILYFLKSQRVQRTFVH